MADTTDTTKALNADESDAVTLWAEIWRLREAVKGPDGYATWQDAATDERIRRVRAEAALAAHGNPRCTLCNYQHGHAIGCENNPFDIALAATQPQPDHVADTRKLVPQPQREPQRDPLTLTQAKALCKAGPVYAPDGKVSLDPEVYRQQIEHATLRGLRIGEKAHGITKEGGAA